MPKRQNFKVTNHCGEKPASVLWRDDAAVKVRLDLVKPASTEAEIWGWKSPGTQEGAAEWQDWGPKNIDVSKEIQNQPRTLGVIIVLYD